MKRNKYGLPERIVFCRSCVISNQRPNSVVEFRSSAMDQKALSGLAPKLLIYVRKENNFLPITVVDM